MTPQITPARRAELARLHGKSDPYLYQCLTGRRDMGPIEARALETATGGELMRWALCQKTWFLIWPELIDQPGAPKLPARKVNGARGRVVASSKVDTVGDTA